MRILCVAKALAIHRNGGFESYVTNLMNAIAKHHTVDVITRDLPIRNKMDIDFNIHPVKTLATGKDAIDNHFAIRPFREKIEELMKENKYDIVHGIGISSLAYKRNKHQTPFVYSLLGIAKHHLVGYSPLIRPFLGLFFNAEKKCVAQAEKNICISTDTLREAPIVYNQPKEKFVHIPCGTNQIKGNKIKSSSFNIGFCGFLNKRKGIHLLVEAMPSIIKEKPSSLLHIVGSGPMKTWIKKRIDELGIQNNVIMHEFMNKEELEKLYKTFDIFVLPSQYEGFGIVLLEAMSSSTPIIAADVADIKKITENSGIILPSITKESISSAVIKLANNQKLRKKYAINAKKKAAEFTWPKIALQVTDVYKKLI